MADTGDVARKVTTMKAFLGAGLYIINPVLLIWALNALFQLAIPFTLKTWSAGFILLWLLRFACSKKAALSSYPSLGTSGQEAKAPIEHRVARENLKAALNKYAEALEKGKPPEDG